MKYRYTKIGFSIGLILFAGFAALFKVWAAAGLKEFTSSAIFLIISFSWFVLLPTLTGLILDKINK
jgi:hypothetical protein